MKTTDCTNCVVGALLFLGLMHAPVLAGSEAPVVEAKAGLPAPPLKIDTLLQAPPGASPDWDSLRGKVMVLEFWSTRCAPCVALIPHLNALKDKFADKPVQFIAVTDQREDDERTVRRFLETRPKKGWIALAANGSASSAYGIRWLPGMVLIDARGRVAGWTSPYSLLEHPEILTDLLEGKIHEGVGRAPPPVGDSSVIFSDLPEELLEGAGEGAGEGDDAPLCLVLIRRAKERKVLPFIGGDSRGMRWDGVTAKEAIAKVYNVVPQTIAFRAPLPEDEKFDVIYRWSAPNRGAARALVQQAVASAFGVDIRREQQERDVYLLSLVEGKERDWVPALHRVKFDKETGLTAPNEEMLARMKAGERFYWTNGDTEWLASQLGHLLDRPVVDEAKIEGYYLFIFPREGDSEADPANVEAITAVLREKYGLKLTPARRSIEVLVVESAAIAKSEEEQE